MYRTGGFSLVTLGIGAALAPVVAVICVALVAALLVGRGVVLHSSRQK